MPDTALSDQHREESLSCAHLDAIAAQAGMVVEYKKRDYKVDGYIEKYVEVNDERGPNVYPLRFQLKASRNCTLLQNGTEVSYQIEVSAYNYMVGVNKEKKVPTILILCSLHVEEDQWVIAGEESTVLKNCCYWHYLTGEPLPKGDNDSRKAIRIPRRRLLNPESLAKLMEAIDDGGDLSNV